MALDADELWCAPSGRGETFALVGESGCGKSDDGVGLMRLLPENGNVEEGRIEIEGHDVLAWNRACARCVAGASA